MFKDPKETYRLRVESCIGTIIDVHKSIHYPGKEDSVFSHFEKLKDAVNDMDMNDISEMDVVRVEQATNALLGEFRPLFEAGGYRPVYEKEKQ